MNAGVVSSRYAKALLKYVQESGAGEKVYSQASVLVERMKEFTALEDTIQKHPEIDLDRRLYVIEVALGEPLAPELKRFICLLGKNRRMNYIIRVLQSFISQYRAANGIKEGTLLTAVSLPGLRQAIEEIMHEKTGDRVLLHEDTDESLIGGFILRLDDLRLDASVDSRLRRLRKELIDDNDRII